MKFGRAVFGVLAALTLAVVVPTTAGASVPAGSGDYCVQDLAGGPETCFATEPQLDAYMEEAALRPLITMFNAINYGGGHKNYVSAYGRERCRWDDSGREASSGDLSRDRYSTGVTLDRTISSFVILANSGCSVYFYTGIGFTGISVSHGENCPDMRDCVAGGGWNDRARSFGVT
jgi:hypothetical protein